jgi:DNA-binding PadR family transcriptional regulator
MGMDQRELLLLGLLRMESMHGYQLNDFLEQRLAFITDLKKSTAYYTLDKLAQEGYVTRHTEREGRRPERRVYELAEKGMARFHQLLEENLSRFHRTFYDDDIGVLFMSHLSPNQVCDALLKKRAEAQASLQAIGTQVDHEPDSPVQYVIEHLRAHLRTDIEWIDQLLARTEAASSGDKLWSTEPNNPSRSLCLNKESEEIPNIQSRREI